MLKALTRAGQWGALSLAPNLLWEISHLPLYRTWSTDSPAALASSVTHCTAGDGLIAAATFLLTAAVVRSTDWPRTAPILGLTLASVLGVTYTGWSEYHNVYVAGSWSYAPAMPTVGGIGASPLLQWMLLPGVTLWIQRHVRR